MQRRRGNNLLYYVSIVIIMLFFGCSVEQTHRTLTFFFDGVDKVIFYNAYLSKDSLSKDAVAKREALLKRNRPELCVHKPYKEKKCDECHTPEKRLLMAMPDLCYKCHANFTETYKIVHGPVASGSCLNCHNQHSSKFAKLLIRQGQQICLYCHNSSLIFANKVHKDIEDAECVLCHNPHGGNNRFMVRSNISKDANRIAQMDDLTYRHLYGQVFCKVPGDINNILEIYIVDSRETIVATAHPDLEGKFYLSNLHPDQTYSFRFKRDIPDCKINIMDNNGTILYVLEKNKKGKYIFDKATYESVHSLINDAHFLGDTLRTTVIYNDKNSGSDLTQYAKEPISNASVVNAAKPADAQPVAPSKGKIVVTDLPGTVTQQTGIEPAKTRDTVASVPSSENKPAENTAYKGKIVVKPVPENVSTADLLKANRPQEDSSKEVVSETKIDTPVYKGKIVVKALPDSKTKDTRAQKNNTDLIPKAGEQTENNTSAVVSKKSRIVVQAFPDSANIDKLSVRKLKPGAGATEAIRKYEVDGVTLRDLTFEIAKFYEGNVVCVLNDSADYLDIATVNAKGEFLLYGFLSFRMTLPDTSTGIVGQTIFLNERMEVIESINKRISNGRYIYVSNHKEPLATRATIRIYADKRNAVLFTSVYFDESTTAIPAIGMSELDKTVDYLKKYPASRAYLAVHSDSRESIGVNRRLSGSRLKLVTDYLVSKGVKKTRINVKKQDKTDDKNVGAEDEHQKNRRLDIYIKDN